MERTDTGMIIQERTNWIKMVLEVLVTVLLTSLFSIFLTNLFDSNQCDISIGTSIINDNEIMTPISIKNNSKNRKIEDLGISAGEYNEIINVVADLSFLIDKNKKIITIKYIPPKETISIILITKDIVDLDSVKIAYSGNINTTYLEDKSDKYNSIFSQAFIYSILLFIVVCLQDKIQKKNVIEYNKLNRKIDKITEESDRLLVERKEEIKQLKKNKHENRIYYLTRMKDLKKELEFWKDTIRKFIYQSSNSKKMNSDELFEVVTDTLKTYGTRNNSDTNFDEIFYLAHMMNENNKGNESEL